MRSRDSANLRVRQRNGGESLYVSGESGFREKEMLAVEARVALG